MKNNYHLKTCELYCFVVNKFHDFILKAGGDSKRIFSTTPCTHAYRPQEGSTVAISKRDVRNVQSIPKCICTNCFVHIVQNSTYILGLVEKESEREFRLTAACHMLCYNVVIW